jgi:hypothetical protein
MSTHTHSYAHATLRQQLGTHGLSTYANPAAERGCPKREKIYAWGMAEIVGKTP